MRMRFRSVSLLFRDLSSTPTLLSRFLYYYLLHIFTETFYFTVFSFSKNVQQLDGISPRDKPSHSKQERKQMPSFILSEGKRQREQKHSCDLYAVPLSSQECNRFQRCWRPHERNRLQELQLWSELATATVKSPLHTQGEELPANNGHLTALPTFWSHLICLFRYLSPCSHQISTGKGFYRSFGSNHSCSRWKPERFISQEQGHLVGPGQAQKQVPGSLYILYLS